MRGFGGVGLRNETLAQDVYRQLKHSIVTFQLLPGTPLPEAELSEQLNVSRTPIREALRILESEGLVEIEARRGARVAQISLEDVRDAYEVRGWLESAAAAKAAQVMDAEALAKLEAAIEKLSVEPVTHEGAACAAAADVEFHDLIIKAASNKLAKELIDQARAITARAAYFVPPGRYSESREEHKAILRALRERNSEEARELMCNHVKAAANRRFGLNSHQKIGA